MSSPFHGKHGGILLILEIPRSPIWIAEITKLALTVFQAPGEFLRKVIVFEYNGMMRHIVGIRDAMIAIGKECYPDLVVSMLLVGW